MTTQELQAALVEGCRVKAHDVTYARVTAVILRRTATGQTYVQAELMDITGRSVSISSPQFLERAES